MKKIVGILGMAAVLASGAFAAEPAADFMMAEFTGNAEFGWKADFSGDNARMGMFNGTAANLKFGFVKGGDKTTSGDGVWGELKIAVDGTSVNNGAIKLGDRDPKDGGYKAEEKLVTTDKDNVQWLNLPNLFPVPAVKTAKIHFVSGDFNLALDIMKPSLEYGAFSAPAATGSTISTLKVGDMRHMNAGFGIEVGLADVFGLNFKFMDNGIAVEKDKAGKVTLDNGKDKKYGLAFDASLLAVENLSAKVMGTFNFDTDYSAFAVDAGYKFGITDKMYVKPGIAFTMQDVKDNDKVNDKNDAKYLEAGVLFGWGAADQEPGFAWVPNKTTEGVSVAFGMDMKDATNLTVALYDQSLMSLLGDDFGTLKTGVLYTMANSKVNDKKITASLVAAGLRYAVTFSPVYIELGADFKMDMLTDKDTLNSFKISAKLGSKEIIDNTDVYVAYNFGDVNTFKNAAKGDYTKVNAKTNELTIGTKISF